MEDKISCVCQEHYDNFLSCEKCFQRFYKAQMLKAENKKLIEEIEQRTNYLKKVLGKITAIEGRMKMMSDQHPKPQSTNIKQQSQGSEVDLMTRELPQCFFSICKDPELAMSFLLRCGAIPKTRKCDKCTTEYGSPEMRIENYGCLGYSFHCTNCNSRSNIKENTFWAKCQLNLDKILLFMFLWALGMKDSEIANLLDCSPTHIIHLSRRIRKLVCKDFMENLPKFNGVVEIDEQNFIQRKIEIGKGKAPQKWVLLMYERDTKLAYLEPLEKRSFENILPVIQKHCEVGTVILTSKHGAYGRLENYGYPHYTFEKFKGFENAENKEVHIRGTITLWLWAKHNIKVKNRSAIHLEEHLREFLWRREIRQKCRYKKLLESAEVLRSVLDLISRENHDDKIE